MPLDLHDNPGEQPKDFFVSYTAPDRTWAEWIAWVLEEAGYTVVVQAWDFRPGSNFVSQMQEAARQTERTLVVLSHAYMASEFGEAEWTAAFADDPTGKSGKLVPVRIEEFDPPGLWKPLVYIDLVGTDEERASEVLLTGTQRRRAKPPSRPVFPGAAGRVVPAAPRFPGQLPAIWRMPHLRNPRFVGRAATLAWLNEELSDGGRVALYGLGGVGKTQVVLEYVYGTVGEVEVVWWVRAEDTATLVEDLAALADPLGIARLDSSRDTAARVVEALRTRSDWLVIFDNAPAPEATRPWLPAGTSGRVVITTRNPAIEAVAPTRQLHPLDLDEASRLLTNRVEDADQAEVESLAERLGRLPLALDQAASYMVATGRSIGDYMELLDTARSKLLSRGQLLTDYPETVATTWDLAFDEVGRSLPAAVELLRVMAFLAADQIPRRLFTNHHTPDDAEDEEALQRVGLDEAVRDSLLLDDLIMALRSYSLVDIDADRFSVHRLIQDITRERLDNPAPYIHTCVSLVTAAFAYRSTDPGTWTSAATAFPHATRILHHADTHEVATSRVSWLHTLVGRYLRDVVASYSDAELHMRQALSIDEATSGPDDPIVAVDLADLADLLRATGRLDEAEAMSRRALNIEERAHGPNGLRVATALNNLAVVLDLSGQHDEAERRLRQALSIQEAVPGSERPEVASTLNNYARLLRATGRYEAAETSYRRALTIHEAAYGPDHPEVGRTRNNLAGLFVETGRYEEAEPLYRQALAICEAAYGPDHPDFALTLGNLADLLRETKRHDEAEPLYRRALTIHEAAYGPDHPTVGSAMTNLALLLSEQGQLAEAERLYGRALTTLEASYGPNHAEVATILNNLGDLVRSLGRYDEAEPLFRRALAIHEAAYGPDHPKVGTTLNNLALLLDRSGQSAEAESLYERALTIHEEALGSNHPNVASILTNLALHYMVVGEHAKAELMISRHMSVVASVGKRLDSNHPLYLSLASTQERMLQALSSVRSEQPSDS